MSVVVESHITLHLCPETVWEAQRFADAYFPEAFQTEGFIHCTDGDERMISVANRYYTLDAREFIVLSVDLGANGESWRYEDPDRVYPHIFGPIHPTSVMQVRRVLREPSGLFVAIASSPGVTMPGGM
jgi:uncharacterized protein (DUF952 family)